MDADTKQRIEAAVMEILQDADMEEATEYQVRAAASERLGLDLSPPVRKLFVRSVVESFLSTNAAAEEEATEDTETATKAAVEAEEEEEVEHKKSHVVKEYDDDGDLVICTLSNKRKVTVQDFKGRKLVSIREYYEKGGKQLPSSKGISLPVEQWEAFRKAVPSIVEAIEKLEGPG